MITVTELTNDVKDWEQSEYWVYQGNNEFNKVSGGVNYAAVSLVLGKKVEKKHIEKFLSLSEEFNLHTTIIDIYEESGVQVVIFVHDHYDAEFSSKLKFLDWDIDGLHVGSLPNPKDIGVILLDMDATCVQCECIDEMAKLAGIGEQVSAVTSMAMKGHMEFQESFRRRIALFEGKSESVMDVVEKNLPIMPGFAEMVKKAKSCGWKIAIASGGFTRFVGKLKREFDLDYVVANTIEAINGIFTGKVLGQIVDSKVKADTLLMLREKYGISAQNSIAVGDGANDLPMISLAGTGVAIHAKPIVREKAPVAISNLNLHVIAAILEAGLRLNSKFAD